MANNDNEVVQVDKTFDLDRMKKLYVDAREFCDLMKEKFESGKALTPAEKKKVLIYIDVIKYIKNIYASNIIEDVAIKNESEFQKKIMAANEKLEKEINNLLAKISECEGKIKDNDKSRKEINNSKALNSKLNMAKKNSALMSLDKKDLELNGEIANLNERINVLEAKIIENNAAMTNYVKNFVDTVLSHMPKPNLFLKNIFSNSTSLMDFPFPGLTGDKKVIGENGEINRGMIDAYLSYVTGGEVRQFSGDMSAALEKKRVCDEALHFLNYSVMEIINLKMQLKDKKKFIEQEKQKKSKGFFSKFSGKKTHEFVNVDEETYKLGVKESTLRHRIWIETGKFIDNLRCSVAKEGDSPEKTFSENAQFKDLLFLLKQFDVNVDDLINLTGKDSRTLNEEEIDPIKKAENIFSLFELYYINGKEYYEESFKFITDELEKERELASNTMDNIDEIMRQRYDSFNLLSIGFRGDKDTFKADWYKKYNSGLHDYPNSKYVSILTFLTVCDDYAKAEDKDKITDMGKVAENQPAMINQEELERQIYQLYEYKYDYDMEVPSGPKR